MLHSVPPAPLKRPRLLVRAARAACALAPHRAVLRRAFGGVTPQTDTAALAQILALEEELNTQRKTGRGDYAVARHVDVLAALIVLMQRASVLR